MQTKFSTSTNIIRDSDREIRYIPTPNSKQVVNLIANDFKKGIHSFNVIGSFGTGKSSFLWAFQQCLRGKKEFFEINIVPDPRVEVINFIGEYRSIISSFADYFQINPTEQNSENVLCEIFNHYHDLGDKSPLLVIVIDEFGKFLEYASQNNPEKELYFIQQLSEFVNNQDQNILLLTTVHQSFDAYAFSLNPSQKLEWTKVKGRFREITFNEPVEQLLFLAAEHLKSNKVDNKIAKSIQTTLSLARASSAYSINQDYEAEVAMKLFPLDIIAANILTIALQKYGQNERSLFSFLESTDHTGINSFDYRTNPFYNASCVYDYLVFNFYSYINSRFNPDFAAWATIRNSLEEVEVLYDKDYQDYSKIIKTIGLLNLTSSAGADLGSKFLVSYAKTCLGIVAPEVIIENLQKRKLILYGKYNKRFSLYTGTDLDISYALIEAGNKVSEIVDVSTLLQKYYQLPHVLAKSYSYNNGTPRIFEFKISEYPITECPTDEVDGFVNLIFNESITKEDVKKHSHGIDEAILFGFYQNSKTIKNLLFEIEKTKKVIEENDHDKPAVKELNNILFYQKNLLNHYILNNLYSKNPDLIWIFRGKELIITSKKDFNKRLSLICSEVYSKAPVFRNELVNRNKISSSIGTAKRFFLTALVNNWNKPDLGFEKDKFPPEKTIFITLLRENSLSLYSDEINFTTQVSDDSSFIYLWDYSVDFLNNTKKSKRSISEFIEPLTRQPFKLKQGLIDFWLPTFLFIKRDDFALFSEKGYIPVITDKVLDLIIKNPHEFEIKAFDIEGVKLDIFNSYRLLLNQNSKEKLDNQTFIETIKPFLTFYTGLLEYSKNTSRLKKETIAIRNAIATSKDPEKSFFEDFPVALGYSIDNLQRSSETLQNYITKLHDSIRELRSSYDNLLTRFEDFIINEFIGDQLTFDEYKAKLQNRYKKLKKHLCLPHQKTFIQRLDSQLDDRNAWLSSIAQVVVGKSLDTIKDEDEIILYDKFKTLILDLDSLTNISKVDVDYEKEDVFGIELSSFVDGIKKSLIRLPKTKSKDVSAIEVSIKSQLSNDKSLNIAALANVLKDLLKK
jgi:chaperonin cofactor prefoldin